MKNIGELRYIIKQNLFKNKDGVGIMELKKIQKININKFLESDRSYYNSYELWLIAKDMYREQIENEIQRLAEEFDYPYDFVEKEFVSVFKPRAYDGSLLEAIVIWNLMRARNWKVLALDDKEDQENKIDIRALYKPKSLAIHFQIKKFQENPPKDYVEKIERDLLKAKKEYGKMPEFITIYFDEANKSKRCLMWQDENGEIHSIHFQGSFGRSRNFLSKFESILEKIVAQNKYK